jgi:dihydrofolate reductase
LREAFSSIAVIVTGRRTFDITNGWGGRHPLDVPVFVLTHSVPNGWDYEGSPFTFVTDGIESAVDQAREVAGEKNVAVGAASLVQQCLRPGCWTRYTWTSCPCCSVAGSGCSTTSGRNT